MSILPYPPVTQWRHPSSSKRALCLHPMVDNSQFWHHVADRLVAQGYLVTAPDLLGHGLALASTDYSLKAFADALLPLLSATDVVIGASFGAIVALPILPHLSGSSRVVLVDPPVKMSSDAIEMIRKMAIQEIKTPMTIEEDVRERNYTTEVAIWRAAARGLCRISAVEGILQENVPRSHTHRLPGPSPTQEIIILAADPTVFALFTEADAAQLKQTHPHIKTKLVKGAGHNMVLEIAHRDAIVEAALGIAGADV